MGHFRAVAVGKIARAKIVRAQLASDKPCGGLGYCLGDVGGCRGEMHVFHDRSERHIFPGKVQHPV